MNFPAGKLDFVQIRMLLFPVMYVFWRLPIPYKHLSSNLPVHSKSGKQNFLTNSVNADFKRFIFPLQVEAIAKIVEIKKSIGNNLICSMLITFIQNEEECVSLICKSSILDSNYVEEKESNLAAQCINTYLSSSQRLN